MRKMKKKLKKHLSRFLALALVLNMAVAGTPSFKSEAATRSDVVGIALSQVNYHEKASNANLDDFYANSGSGNYNKYARDIGIANGQPWCATFVWWCAQAAGTPSDLYPHSAYVPTIYNWFQARGSFRARGTYEPQPGDYIIFGNCDHIGIVSGSGDGMVHTIEGNSSDKVTQHTYFLTNGYILGYGIMDYTHDHTAPTISDVTITDQSADGYTVNCKVQDDTDVTFVFFPTWTDANGQDDMDPNWDKSSSKSLGTKNGDNVTFRVNTSDHNNEGGLYRTHIYASDSSGNVAGPLQLEITVDNKPPVISNVEVSNLTSEGYQVNFQVEDDSSGIRLAACPTWTTEGGTDDLPDNWDEQDIYYADLDGKNGSYQVNISDHNGERGGYQTRIVAYDKYNNITQYDVPEVIVPPAEITNDEPQVDEPQPDEPQTDEPQIDEPQTDEPQPDEPQADEPQTDEPQPDEPQADEPQTDESQAELPAGNQTQNDEINTNVTLNYENNAVTTNTTNNQVTNNYTTNNITNNTTNNNTTNNTTNNTRNETVINNVYSVAQEPDEMTSNYKVIEPDSEECLSDGLKAELEKYIDQRLSEYFPEGFEVLPWDGEVSVPEADVIVDYLKNMKVDGLSFEADVDGKKVTFTLSFK